MVDKESLITFLEKERQNFESIINAAKACCEKIDVVSSQVHSSDELTQEECTLALEHFDIYKNSIGEIKSFFKLYSNALCTMSNHLMPSKIKWIPENSRNMKMSYKAGDSPWSVHLIHSNGVEMADCLCSFYRNEGPSIKHLRKVNTMDFVCSEEADDFYRVLVLEIDPSDSRSKILYFVDTGNTATVKHSKFYELPGYLAEVPPQSMQCIMNCSLTPQDRIFWPYEMGEIFDRVLSRYELLVSVVDETDSIPPSFEVDITIEGKEPRSLNDWICNSVFPELKKFRPGDKMDVFLKRMESNGLFDPFHPKPRSPLFGIASAAAALEGEPNDDASAQNEAMATLDKAVQVHAYKPVMRHHLRSFAIEPKTGSVLVVRAVSLISDNSAYILMPVKFSNFQDSSFSWSEINKVLDEDWNVERYEERRGIPLIDEILIVKSLRGQFQRARVVEIISVTHVEVFYIDHGYSETVLISDLKNLPIEYIKVPAQAVKATFDFCESAFTEIRFLAITLVKVLSWRKVGNELELTLQIFV